jgi:hypothetical protein
MTRVLYYNVFLKKEINEQASVDYAKHSIREYKDAMKYDQGKYVWIMISLLWEFKISQKQVYVW